MKCSPNGGAKIGPARNTTLYGKLRYNQHPNHANLCSNDVTHFSASHTNNTVVYLLPNGLVRLLTGARYISLLQNDNTECEVQAASSSMDTVGASITGKAAEAWGHHSTCSAGVENVWSLTLLPPPYITMVCIQLRAQWRFFACWTTRGSRSHL
jgi:hypothetical protein